LKVQQKKPIKSHRGIYARTIDEFLKTDAPVCKPDCSGVNIVTAYNGFDRAIKNKYSDRVLLSRVDGEIYIEKL